MCLSCGTVAICLPLVTHRWNCHASKFDLAVASVSLGLLTQFVHCCLVTARAFILASLIVIPYTTLEISKFLGQLLVDDDDDDEKSQLIPSIASLRIICMQQIVS